VVLPVPNDVYQDIERLAKAKRKSAVQVMRDLVTRGLQDEQKGTSHERRGRQRLADLGLKGPADLSLRIDDYLYGEGK
jgi:hypothetical protein